MLAGVPILILGLAAGTAAAASGGSQTSNYSCPGINEPFGITAGPNGQQALWFTNAGGEPSSPGGSIGEIATSGQCSNFGGSLIDDPTGITAGPGWGAVVHQLRLGHRGFDRRDHHLRGGHPLHRGRH